ncbi:MAG: hypothetical protein WC341_07765 [Bacteroidales bacterium]|jgi:hypothetical protein
MSTTSGVFSETLIQTLYKKASDVAFDSRINQQFIPQIEALKALAAIQGGRILEGVPALKDGDVALIWDNFCNIIADTNTGCEFPTTKSSTNSEIYTVTWEKMAGFQLDEADFDNNMASMEEHYAKASLMAEKVLVEAFTQYVIGKLNTFKGVNVVSTGLGTVVGTDTYVLSNLFNAAMIPYISRVAQLNQMVSPIFLTGNNLWESYYAAKFNALDKTQENLYNQLRLNFDLVNIDSVNSPDYVSYLISQGSIALLNKWYNKPTVETSEEGQRWSVNGILFPQFKFDVFKKTVCDTGTNDRWSTVVKYKLKADIVLNPTGCSATNTGLLSFICGAVPEV